MDKCSADAIEFSKTLINNVHVYYIQSSLTVPGEYSFCKLYSNFCHCVLTHFFYENSDIFGQELKDSTAYRKETDLRNVIQGRYKQWFVTEKNPPDSQYFIICAKIAILGIFISQHNKSILEQSEEIIANIAQRAINLGILKESYDEERNEAKVLIDSVYKWYDIDLKDYATEPDNELGWKERELLMRHVYFLEDDGRLLLNKWNSLTPFTYVNRRSFINLIYYLYKIYVKTSSNSIEIMKFILAISVLSVHCNLQFNFFEGTEIVIDIASRQSKGNVFNNFKYNTCIEI